MIKKLVNSNVYLSGNELQQQFENARPFRHLVIDNFLDDDFARSLLADFPTFDEKLAINENGEVGAKAVHENITHLGPAWQRLDKLVQGEEFRAMISEFTGIPALQFDPHYFGGGTHENLHGQSLSPHIDFNYHPVTRMHRRMNLILYLSPEWHAAWGGSIQLHRDPYKPPAEDDIVTVTPAFNRCVIFETNEHSWHGFRRINLPEDKRHVSRKSFALYYYTDTRPLEELGTEHSTIYVEDHLPEDFHAGMELSAEQLQHVKNLLSSRDQHLIRLYANIKKLYSELNDARGSLSAIETTGITAISENDNKEVMALKNRVAGLQQRIRDFEDSTSWRITRPLRALKRRFGNK